MIKNELSISEAAKLMRVPSEKIHEWIESGKLTAFKSPLGNYRILKKDLRKFADEHDLTPLMELEHNLERILIVDDDEIVLQTLQTMIRKQFPDVLIKTATGGNDAKELIPAFEPDLSIVDIGMEKMDGFNVCDSIRNTPSRKDSKIIIITGLLGEDLQDKSIVSGADAFLAKPVKFKKLVSVSVFRSSA